MDVEKQRFLVCYDYGAGGLWALIDARDESEVLALYPELTVVMTRPKWLSDKVMADIESTELHDIDGQPFGVLNAVLADRARD